MWSQVGTRFPSGIVWDQQKLVPLLRRYLRLLPKCIIELLLTNMVTYAYVYIYTHTCICMCMCICICICNM